MELTHCSYGNNCYYTPMQISIILLITGLIEALLSLPMIMGKVPRNRLYGFRLKKTLSDDKYWYPANKRAGIGLLLAGITTSLLSVLVFYNFLKPNALTISLVCILPVVLMLIDSLNYLKKLE